MNEQAITQRHPPGLYVLFFTEMWERFGFYSMLAMFTLYLRSSDGGLGWTPEQATTLYSWYLMFVYASPLVGGLIADLGLGYRNSVLIGGLVFLAGYGVLGVRAEWAVYLALTLLVIGNGFFKPNVSAMVGHLYPEGSPLKDRAFNIFYMGINIGAFLAPLVAEFVQERYGFNTAFLSAAVGMVICVNILWWFRSYVQPPKPVIPELPDEPAKVESRGSEEITTTRPADAETAVTEDVPPAVNLPPPLVSRSLAIDAVPAWLRVGALLVIFAIVIVFWMVFHQNGSTLTYWADDNTDWSVVNQLLGRKVSGIISNAINPFWVVTLTFPLVWFWGRLNPHGLEPSTPTKIALGMFLTAGSFLILYYAARTGEAQQPTPAGYATADFRINQRSLENLQAEGVPGDVLQKLRARGADGKYLVLDKKFATDDKSTGLQKLDEALKSVLDAEQADRYRPAIQKHAYLFQVSPLWLILSYAVVTLGELLLSPMGLSLVSKVAPVQIRGLMMGCWFGATAIGNKFTAIGVYWDQWLQSTFFAVLGAMALVMAVVLLLLLKPLQKAMPGV
jgi:POT family proton-dependent oligopeptide transporter